jgi:hypothetical protein
MMQPIDLRHLADERGYRVTLDPSSKIDRSYSERPWLVRIPGKHGFVSPHSETHLDVWCDARRLFDTLLRIPGTRIAQKGDAEIRVIFGPNRLDEVCEVIRARKKRTLTPEQRHELVAAGAKHRFQSGA